MTDTPISVNKTHAQLDQRRSARLAWIQKAMCAFLMAEGLSVMLGWLSHAPLMFRFWDQGAPLVFNTGVGLGLCGLSLSLLNMSSPKAKKIGWIVSVFVGLLGLATLVEFVFGVSFGIDMVAVQSWYEYGNTQAGRMAPNTAIGLMLCSGAICLSLNARARRGALALAGLIFLIFIVGVTGILGNFLAPDLLFGWSRSARMAMPTATGLLMCAVALWTGFISSHWHSTQQFLRFDEVLRMVSAATLVVATSAAGLSGFVINQHKLQFILEKNIDDEMISRMAWRGAA
jgi:hypothetical protein